jgi:hypothetical protein
MSDFVFGSLEVEIMGNRLGAILLRISQNNRHVEFSPSLLLELKRRFLERYQSDTFPQAFRKQRFEGGTSHGLGE